MAEDKPWNVTYSINKSSHKHDMKSELFHLYDTYGLYQNYVLQTDEIHEERAENILVACHVVGSDRIDCKGLYLLSCKSMSPIFF